MVTNQASRSSSVLVFEEHDDLGNPTGRKTTFEGAELLPLGFSELDGLKLDGPISIPLNWSAARIVQTDHSQLSTNELVNLRAPLESHFSSKAIGLVRGGWLPSGLALREDMVVMPDRCTISALASRFRDGAKTREGDDFLDFFQGKSVKIHPGLFAMEGNERRPPSPQQVWDQWAEAKQKIQRALPNAQITQSKAVLGLIGMLGEMRDAHARKVKFLRLVVPDLRSPVSAGRRAEVWQRVLETADTCGLPRNSLVVLAALSIVCVKNGAGPAKRLIKPSANYSDADAYNALADLRALEVLINLYAAFPQEQIMLCTGDKNLSLLWAGIRATEFRMNKGGITYTLSPVEALLPNVEPSMLEAYLSNSENS